MKTRVNIARVVVIGELRSLVAAVTAPAAAGWRRGGGGAVIIGVMPAAIHRGCYRQIGVITHANTVYYRHC